jgi:hypothetical protein
LVPVVRSMHGNGLRRLPGRWVGMETFLRIFQLTLMLWLALLGSEYLAKGVMQIGAMVVSLLP